MPKPVLSDSAFNADDVATAILSEANLQVTNEDLGVTDRSSLIVFQSGWQETTGSVPTQFYTFNGFGFISLYCYHAGGTPATGEDVFYINDSDYHPVQNTAFFTSSHHGDTSLRFTLNTNGMMDIIHPKNEGDSDFFAVLNGFYRY